MSQVPPVQDVVLLAAPVTLSAARWERMRSVVAGRLINAYDPSDASIGICPSPSFLPSHTYTVPAHVYNLFHRLHSSRSHRYVYGYG